MAECGCGYHGALDVFLEQSRCASSTSTRAARLCRRQIPRVRAESNIGCDEQREQQDRSRVFDFEILAHQLLAYTTVN